MSDETDRSAADREAAENIAKARPVWTGLALARDALDLADRMLLHAGPPFESPAALPAPVLNSAIHSILFEGWAEDREGARRMILDGAVTMRPAQERQTCAALAATISPSMRLQVVEDAAASNKRAFAPINAGMTLPLPHGGADDPAVVERHRFVNETIAPLLPAMLGEPIKMLPIIDASLQEGDDCHGLTGVGSAMIRGIAARRLCAGADRDRLLAFLDDAPGFFLFLVMAACKAMMMAAEGAPGASIVTTAGGNGQQFGIRLAGLPDRWFVGDSAPPEGPVAEGARPLGAIGDSAVIDAMGFGGMTLASAPALLEALGDHASAVACTRPSVLLETTHPALFGGKALIGLSARKVIEMRLSPLAVLGILDADGKKGIVGRGLFSAPLAPFAEAVAALDRD